VKNGDVLVLLKSVSPKLVESVVMMVTIVRTVDMRSARLLRSACGEAVVLEESVSQKLLKSVVSMVTPARTVDMRSARFLRSACGEAVVLEESVSLKAKTAAVMVMLTQLAKVENALMVKMANGAM